MQKNDSKSMAMMIISMTIFGTIGIFRKNIPLSSAVLACYRGIAGAVFLFLLIKLQNKKVRHNIGIAKLSGLFLTGAMIGFNWMLLFESYNYTTVATATLCYYMEPIIVILLSPVFFKEKITPRKGFCIIVALAGMFLVSGMVENGIPDISEAKGIIYGLGAALLYASVVIANKKLSGIDTYEKTIVQLASAGVVLIPYLIMTKQSFDINPDVTVIVLLIIVGCIHTGMTYALYFGSMDGLRAQTVALLGYLDPISALILSSVILHEKMTVTGIIGAILVLGAAIFSEV